MKCVTSSEGLQPPLYKLIYMAIAFRFKLQEAREVRWTIKQMQHLTSPLSPASLPKDISALLQSLVNEPANSGLHVTFDCSDCLADGGSEGLSSFLLQVLTNYSTRHVNNKWIKYSCESHCKAKYKGKCNTVIFIWHLNYCIMVYVLTRRLCVVLWSASLSCCTIFMAAIVSSYSNFIISCSFWNSLIICSRRCFSSSRAMFNFSSSFKNYNIL